MKRIKPLLVLLVILTVFSVIVTTGIFWRAEDIRLVSDLPLVPIVQILQWQASIWLPWVLIFFGLNRLPITLGLGPKEPLKFYTTMIVASSMAVILHYGWFVGVSELLNPYQGYPESGYGVFPYFFIYWPIMDVVIVIFCLFYIIFTLKISELSGKPTETPGDRRKSTYLSILVGSEKKPLAIEDIRWIETDNYYAKLHTEDNIHLIKSSLQQLIDELPSKKFIRVHRSTIVNLDFVTSLGHQESKPVVILRDGTNRAISPSGHIELKNILVK